MKNRFRLCPNCNASLDAREHCDCLEKEQIAESFWTGVTQQGAGGQVGFNLRKDEEYDCVLR